MAPFTSPRLVLALLLSLIHTFRYANGFTLIRPLASPGALAPTSTSTCPSVRLAAAAGRGGDKGEEDEQISKLLGKRSGIKRIRKRGEDARSDELEKVPTKPLASSDDGGGGSSSKIAKDANLPSSLGLDMDMNLESGIDFDKVPEFQTKRPVRSPSSDSTSSKKSEEKASKSAAKGAHIVAMDYQSEYDDENELHIPNRLGISTAAWGDVKKGFTTKKKLKKSQVRDGIFNPSDAQAAFNELLSSGVVFWETSPAYGVANADNDLSAEDILSNCISKFEGDIQPKVATTYLNKPWQRGPKPMISSLEGSCKRLGQSNVELLQVQNLGWLYPSGSILNGMNEAIAEVATTNFVGVQGMSPLRLRRIVDKFEKSHNLYVATNTFEFSLTNRKKASWIAACKSLNVIPLVRDPLDGGLASGKYTASNPGGGSSTPKYSFSQLEKLQPLHSVLDTVAERVKTRVEEQNREKKDRARGRFGESPPINTDITTTQVAINYVISKGAVPLPEVNNLEQAKEVLGCLGWTLTDEEIGILESAADLCK